MKSITRFIPLLAVYRTPIFLSIICQIGVAVFTVASIPAFIPFIRVIFGRVKAELSRLIVKFIGGVLSLPLQGSKAELSPRFTAPFLYMKKGAKAELSPPVNTNQISIHQ